MAYSFGQVVLVPFPFTDQSGTKRRPAVIVSSNPYNSTRRDLIILAITSQVRQPFGLGEALISHWQSAGLPKPSVLKPVISTLEQHLVVKSIGLLAPDDQHALREIIKKILG